MANTIYQSGRLGNCFFSTAMLLAYSKKHNLTYTIPSNADAYREHSGHINNPFNYILSTGYLHHPFRRFTESNIHTTPYFQELPLMDNTVFDGYFQSFKYFDWCREYVLQKFNFPNKIEYGITSISVRRGDCVNSPNFPICPLEYYQNAVFYMQKKGFNKFRIYSDDIRWCKAHFNIVNFPETQFEFSEGKIELDDYKSMLQCENNITARSTFSLTAAWCNQNPEKIVCVPTTKFEWWRGMNKNLLTDTGFVEIDFDKIEDLQLERQY